MSETKGHDPHHVDPQADQNSDEKLAQGIAEVIIGKNTEKVSANPLEIAKVLSDSNVSLVTDLQRVKQFIEDSQEAPQDKDAVEKRVKGIIIGALETKKADLLAQKKEIEEKIAKKREALEKDPEIKEEIDKLTNGLTGTEKRDKKNTVLESELMKDDEYEELKKDLEGVKKLLKLVKENPNDALFTVLKKKKTPEPKHDGHGKPDDHGHGKPDDHGHGKPDDHGHGKPDDHGHGKTDAHGHGKPDDHGHDKHDDHGKDKHDGHGHDAEHKDEAPAVVEAKDMHVKHVAEFEKPEDIANAQLKWKAVVNDLGKKPTAGDELFFQNQEGELTEITDNDTVLEYWRFMTFMNESVELENDIQKLIQEVKIDVKGKDQNSLEEEIDTKAQDVLRKLSGNKRDMALLYFVLGVKNKARAFEKIKNVIKLQVVPNERKGKNTYEEERDESGKVVTVDLKKFLEEHQEYGDRMLANSQEVLVKLHKKFGGKIGDLAAFRDVLIQVVKSKGSKEIEGKVTADEAKAIYTNYLISLDPHAGEKEILALIISYKENPPYVFDLVNTTQGWKLDTQKKINILEDFILDGAMYQELRGKTGLSPKEFNTFIIKVAPKYELIRSHLQKKTDKKEEVKVADMNTALGTNLSEAELKHFRKLMELPLWASKVGQAYKHAVYLNDDAGRQVPMMRKIEGPDTVKQLDVMFVNVEEKLKRVAERLADERLDQELKEVGPQGWKQLWRIDKIAVKFWKRNAAEGYRQKYTEEYIKRLKEEPRFRTELMRLRRDEVKPGYGAKLSGKTPAEGTRENISADLDAIAERFGISFASGDTESYLTANERNVENIANLEVQQSIRNLCRDYAEGRINDAQFQNIVRTNIIPQIQALSNPPDASILAFLEESTGKGAVDIEKAGLLDKMRAHRAGLIALDLENMKINIRLGKAQNVDVKTQVKSLNWTDRLSRAVVEKVQKVPFLGRFVNPSTVAIAGYGLSNIVAQFATGRLTRLGALTLASAVFAPAVWPAVAGIAGGVAVGSLFSTLRQNKESLRLKAMKERRQALTYEPEDDRKGLNPNKPHDKRFERRLENEGALYQKVPVQTLINNITNAGDYNSLQNALAQAITLNEISEMGLPAVGGAEAQPERVDLIKFSNELNIEAERFQLLRTISQAKTRLRQLGGNRDVNTDMQHALAAQVSAVANQMKASETNFQKIKRIENWKAAGIGAVFGAGFSALGLLIPHTDVQTNTYTLTPKGPATMPDLEANLATVGYSPAQIADIKSHMTFDPSTNKLSQASVDYLRKTYAMTVDGTHVPGSTASSVLDLHSGTNMNKTDLLAELKAQGINTAPLTFDKTGTHLTAADIAYLKSQNANITEVVTSTPGGAMNSTGTAPSGWEKLKSIHFNDNQPHAPNKHVLDELHFWWKGKPQLDPTDGQVHFTAKAMLDPSKLHSKLPAGVGMPSSGTQLKLGLEVKINGVNHWKFFTPDANGDIALPPEYFDTNNLGVVARGGDTLPGLKTHALAVGFEDSKGTYQVLASVKGNGSYAPTPTPTETVEFLGKVTKSTTSPDSDTYTLLRDVTKTTEFRGAMPPIIPGAPMQHLEYGKKGPTQAPNNTPAQAPAAPQTTGPAPTVAPAAPAVAPTAPTPGPAPAPILNAIGTSTPPPAGPNVIPAGQYNRAIETFFMRNNIAKVGNAEQYLTHYLGTLSSFANEQEKFAALDLCANYLKPANLADLIKDDPAHEETANKIHLQFSLSHNKARINAMARFFDENKTTFAAMSEDSAFKEIENLFQAIIGIKDDANMKKVLTEPDASPANPTPAPAAAPTVAATTPPDVAERFYTMMGITKTPEIEAHVKTYLEAPSTLNELEKVALLSVATQYMDPGKMNLLITDEPSLDALKSRIASKFPHFKNVHRNVMARFYEGNKIAFAGMSEDAALQEIQSVFSAVINIKNDTTINNALATPDQQPPVASPVDTFFTNMHVNKNIETEAIVLNYLANLSAFKTEQEKISMLSIALGYLNPANLTDLVKDDPAHQATKDKLAIQVPTYNNARLNLIARFYDENKKLYPAMSETEAFLETEFLIKAAADLRKNDTINTTLGM